MIAALFLAALSASPETFPNGDTMLRCETERSYDITEDGIDEPGGWYERDLFPVFGVAFVPGTERNGESVVMVRSPDADTKTFLGGEITRLDNGNLRGNAFRISRYYEGPMTNEHWVLTIETFADHPYPFVLYLRNRTLLTGRCASP